MKQLTCEICGNTNLVKQDGVFVCQGCGCKYTLEEAKKMIENESPAASTIDTEAKDAKIKNYYFMAQSAFDGNNPAETEKYCNMVLELQPQHYDAWLLKGKAVGCQSNILKCRLDETLSCFEKALTAAPRAEAEALKSEITTSLSLLISTIIHQHKQTGYAAIPAVSIADCIVFAKTKCSTDIFPYPFEARSYALFLQAHYPPFKDATENKNDILECLDRQRANITILDYMVKYETDNQALFEVYNHLYYYAKDYNEFMEAYAVAGILQYSAEEKEACKIKENEYYEKWQQFKPKGGCYVATCVYGSYDCPEVWTLRRYRDDTLGATWYGRLFIRTYYAISPTLVKWFGKTKWFKRMWRGKLDRMVAKLQSKGVESTPYEDKNW